MKLIKTFGTNLIDSIRLVLLFLFLVSFSIIFQISVQLYMYKVKEIVIFNDEINR